MVQVITDSVSSIPRDVLQALNIRVVSLYVHDGDEVFEDATMDTDAFYSRIASMIDNIPTSSQPSQQVLNDLFEEFAKAGTPVLGIFLSAQMSGTFEGALMAAKFVHERYPEWKCNILDSTSNSFDEGFAVTKAAMLANKDASLEEVTAEAERTCLCSRFLFSPESLAYLKAGGRIGKASALLGDLMKITPILTVSDGVASTFGKVRNHQKALAKIASAVEKDVAKYGFADAVVHYIGGADMKEMARTWAEETVAPITGTSVRVLPVSPVIGTHVGPAVGIAYECTSPVEGKMQVPCKAIRVGEEA